MPIYPFQWRKVKTLRCIKHKRVACPECKKVASTTDPYNDPGLWMAPAENQAILASYSDSASSDSSSSSGGDSGSYSSSSDSSC